MCFCCLEKNNILFISLALIAVMGLAAYGSSLSGDFICDDLTLVKYNSRIQQGNIPVLFTEDIGAGAGGESTSNFYRPLQMATYAAEYRLWDLNPFGYHLTNVVLHILVALSIYWLITLLFNNSLLSFFTALFFVGHPIHTEAVSYISGRADPLAALFVILSFIFYIKFLEAKKLRIYFLMLLCYAFALLSRESGLLLIVSIPLYHYAFKKKYGIPEFIPILAITACYFLLRAFALNSTVPHFTSPVGLLDRTAGFFAALANYIRLLILPLDLHMEYGKKQFYFTDPKVLTGLVIFVIMIYFALIRRKNLLISFGILWFLLALLPVSNVYPMSAYMAEHWLYIPSIGFFLLLAGVMVFLYGNSRLRLFGSVLALSLLIFYPSATINQNLYWSDPIIFYKRTLSYSPESARMYNNLGVEYRIRGSEGEAIKAFMRALEINPNLALVHVNLAEVYYKTKRYDLARKHYEIAVKLGHKADPRFLELLKQAK